MREARSSMVAMPYVNVQITAGATREQKAELVAVALGGS